MSSTADEVSTYLEDLAETFKNIPESGPMPTDVDSHISEAEDVLGQLQIAVSSIRDPSRKADVTAKIRQYRERIDKAKKASLFGGERAEDRQLTADERHESNMARLHTARRQLAESEEVGAQTLENLSQQKETIKRTQQNVSHDYFCYVSHVF